MHVEWEERRDRRYVGPHNRRGLVIGVTLALRSNRFEIARLVYDHSVHGWRGSLPGAWWASKIEAVEEAVRIECGFVMAARLDIIQHQRHHKPGSMLREVKS